MGFFIAIDWSSRGGRTFPNKESAGTLMSQRRAENPQLEGRPCSARKRRAGKIGFDAQGAPKRWIKAASRLGVKSKGGKRSSRKEPWMLAWGGMI